MQGVGTFVAEAKAHTALLEVHNIADEIAARGHRHSSKILELKARAASEEEATALGIQPGQRLFYSQIVHYENDVPVQVEDRCVNPLVAPDYLKQDFDRVTPYTYLTQAAPLTAGEHIVEAVIPTLRERELLQLEDHEPGLLIHRRTVRQNRGDLGPAAVPRQPLSTVRPLHQRSLIPGGRALRPHLRGRSHPDNKISPASCDIPVNALGCFNCIYNHVGAAAPAEESNDV